jgi:hypothetical protein
MAVFGKRVSVRKLTTSSEYGYSIEVGDGYAVVVPSTSNHIKTFVPIRSLDLPPASATIFAARAAELPS